MNISAVNGLDGMKLSVALTKQKQNGTPESYIGFLTKIGEDYIILDYDKASNNNVTGISRVIISLDIIQGIWVYK